MKNIRVFHLKIFLFLEVKFSTYLNRRVSVMSTIIVKKGDNTVEHIPEGLCQSLTHLHKDCSIIQITGEIIGGPHSAAEGTFVQGRGLEIPCIYHLFGPQEKKKDSAFGDQATNSETSSIR